MPPRSSRRAKYVGEPFLRLPYVLSQLRQRTSAAPFKTVEDYENNLKRHEDYIAITDRAIDKFREGMETGVYETKLTIGNVVSQLDTQLAMPVEESPFFMPVKNFPEEFSAEEKARLTVEYTAATGEIYAAHERMRDFYATNTWPWHATAWDCPR